MLKTQLKHSVKRTQEQLKTTINLSLQKSFYIHSLEANIRGTCLTKVFGSKIRYICKTTQVENEN